MTSKTREITIQDDGFIRLKFPTYNEALLSFLRNNYPQDLCVWKLENFPDLSATGFQHTSWYFKKRKPMQSFIMKLKKEWDFEIVED